MAHQVVVSSKINKWHANDNNTWPNTNTGEGKYKGGGIGVSNESYGECAINDMSQRKGTPEIAYAIRFSNKN